MSKTIELAHHGGFNEGLSNLIFIWKYPKFPNLQVLGSINYQYKFWMNQKENIVWNHIFQLATKFDSKRK